LLLYDLPMLCSPILNWRAPIAYLLIEDYSVKNLGTLDKCDASYAK